MKRFSLESVRWLATEYVTRGLLPAGEGLLLFAPLPLQILSPLSPISSGFLFILSAGKSFIDDFTYSSPFSTKFKNGKFQLHSPFIFIENSYAKFNFILPFEYCHYCYC
jgi:hypothetical protein